MPGSSRNLNQRQFALFQLKSQFTQFGQHGLKKRGYAFIVKAGGNGGKDRHLFGRCGKGGLIALILLAHIAQGIFSAAAVKLVDGDKMGKIEHVDLFQLRGCPKFRGHHVQGYIHMGHNGGIALANTRGFDNDQVKAGKLAGRNHLGQGCGNFAACFAGGERAHENIGMLNGIHADAVAQKCASGPLAGGINADDGQFQGVFLIQAEAPHQLIGE